MKDSNSLNREDVKILNHQTRFKGYFQVDEYRLQHRQFDGSWGGEITREVFERGHAVVCLPYNPATDEIVLIEQFRPGAYASGRRDCWLIEAIAGIIEDGETAKEVAIREAREEADLKISELIEAGRYLPSAGGCSEEIVLYIARYDGKAVSGIHGLPQEGEDIRAFTTSLDEATEAAISGKLGNLPLVTALLWLNAKREGLRSQWLGLK